MKLTRSCSYRVSYRQDGRKKMTRLDRLEDAVREATNLGNSKRNDQPMYTEIEVWKIEETLVELSSPPT